MIKDTLEKIEQSILAAGTINSGKKSELLALLKNLKVEISSLAEHDADSAESIANFATASAHESVKTQKDSQLIDVSIKGLELSVKRFEVSHPKLVSATNAVATFLSNMGI